MIAAHVRERARFARFVQGGRDHGLRDTSFERDDLCELGRWLYGNGAAYQHLAGYWDLARRHAWFHACAADLVRLREVRRVSNEHLFPASRFGMASAETIAALMALKKEAAAEAARCSGWAGRTA